MEKACTKCGKTKPLDAFGPHKASKDGRQSWCRRCSNEANKRWARENRERVKAGKKRYYEEHKDKYAEDRALYVKRNPEKIKARNAANRAVYQGALKKPDRCETCKRKTPSRRLHAHHHDYSEPLEVQWLCADCHWNEHRDQ